MSDVCSIKNAGKIDNVFRYMIHKPAVIYAPYVKSGMKVLDIGCGAGFATIELARMVGDGGSVTALDIQQEMLDLLKARAEKAGLAGRIRTMCCDAGELEAGETFDFANAFWMVHEVPDTPGLMRNISGCLVPGGNFFVAEPKLHVTRKKVLEMIETARGAGLNVREFPRVRLSNAVIFTPANK